jgi:hypothetical protein
VPRGTERVESRAVSGSFTTEDTEDTEPDEKGRVRTEIRRTLPFPASVFSVPSVVKKLSRMLRGDD